ncbi:MAG: HAMP domain-containing histidine kinase [Actinobacteria bacterium]|nr:HAMP domain-containing histidine kinase [Actinomycetota bacterium]
MNDGVIGPLRQLGLRARITASFAAGAFFIAIILAATSVGVSRSNLLEQREGVAETRTIANAATLSERLAVPDVDAQTLFGSVSTSGKPSAIVKSAADPSGYRSLSLDPRYGASALPKSLSDAVVGDRQASKMRYSRNGEVLLVVGVPTANGGYFEINQVDDIVRSISSLSYRLVGASIGAALLGSVLGYWASRRVLRPLGEVSQVAESIAQGQLDARLEDTDWQNDADLAPLVSSFNSMAAAMQTRIERDARFASDVSHELRSPLMTFSASLEVLQNARDEMPDRAQIALDLLSSDMERFTQLVNDLLEISRFDAGAVRLELDEVLIVETVRMATKAVTKESIPVEADADLDDLVIMCDKRRLIRVLANFLDNARKYAGGATRITIERVEAEPTDSEDEPLTPASVRIAVEDEGPGVTEAERDKIFDRFNRGGQGGSRGTDLGVGLGLALAAEHARLHGGTVWVEGRRDSADGARFVVELPLIEPVDDPESPSLDDAGVP